VNTSGIFFTRYFRLLAGLLLLLVSCDPQVRGIYQVDNRSSGSIYLKRTDDSTYVDSIPAGGNKVLADLPEMGSSYSTAAPVSFMFSSYVVSDDTGATSKTPISAAGNWTTVQVAKWAFEHHFKVTDEDFR